MNTRNIANGVIILPLIWMFSGMYWAANGDKVLATLIIIATLVSLAFYKLKSVKENWQNNHWLWLIAIAACYALFSINYHDFSGREIRATIGACLLLLCFPMSLYRPKWLAPLTAIAATIGLGYTIWHEIILDLVRFYWPINALPYATICGALVILAFAMLLTSTTSREKYLAGYTFLIAIGAVLISQSRGVWLAMFAGLAIITMLYAFRHRLSKKATMYLVLGVAIISTFAWPTVMARYQETQAEITSIQQNNLNTSFGLRLQMWQSAPELIAINPLIGFGGNLPEQLDVLHQQGLVTDTVQRYRPAHMHNQYIDKLVKNGIIGLGILIAMLVYPLTQCHKLSPRGQYMILGLVTMYAVAGLTDMPLYHGQSLVLYLTAIGFILRTTPFQQPLIEQS